MPPELNPASTRCFYLLWGTELLLLWGGCKGSYGAEGALELIHGTAWISCAATDGGHGWNRSFPTIKSQIHLVLSARELLDYALDPHEMPSLEPESQISPPLFFLHFLPQVSGLGNPLEWGCGASCGMNG